MSTWAAETKKNGQIDWCGGGLWPRHTRIDMNLGFGFVSPTIVKQEAICWNFGKTIFKLHWLKSDEGSTVCRSLIIELNSFMAFTTIHVNSHGKEKGFHLIIRHLWLAEQWEVAVKRPMHPCSCCFFISGDNSAPLKLHFRVPLLGKMIKIK